MKTDTEARKPPSGKDAAPSGGAQRCARRHSRHQGPYGQGLRRAGPVGVYSEAQLLGHQHQFPEGQFVAIYENTIVGYCVTFRISGEVALKPHDWVTITGRGFASRHDVKGDWLYGMDVCIRIFAANASATALQRTKAALPTLQLKGIVFADRPHARRRNSVGSAEKYLELVMAGKLRSGDRFRPAGFQPCFHASWSIDAGFATHDRATRQVPRTPLWLPDGDARPRPCVLRRCNTSNGAHLVRGVRKAGRIFAVSPTINADFGCFRSCSRFSYCR